MASPPEATTAATDGQNAEFTVDGIALTSASNTINNAIPGVTFQLLNTTSSLVQVQITNDTNSVVSAVNDLATAYNAVVKGITAQEGKDSTGKAEPLYGDPTLSLLQSQLSSALLGGAASGTTDPLTLLGLSLGKDGTLTFSQSNLEANLSSNYTGIVSVLQDTGSFGAGLNQALSGLGTTAPNGAIYLAIDQNSVAEATLNKNVSDEETRIAARKITLTTELNQANQILQSIPSQLNQVDEMYNAITGYKKS